jgi:hypothetical protein
MINQINKEKDLSNLSLKETLSVYNLLLKEENLNLLKLVMDKNINLKEKSNHFFIEVCSKGYKDYFKILNDYVYQINWKELVDCYNKAATNNHIYIVNELLKNEELNPRANNDKSLRMAAKKNHTEMVMNLINNFKVNITAAKNSALRHSIRNSNNKMFNFIIKSINEKEPLNMRSALQSSFEAACEAGNYYVINYYISHKKTQIERFNHKSLKFLIKKSDIELLDFILIGYKYSSEILPLLIRYSCLLGNVDMYNYLIKNYTVQINGKKGRNLELAITSNNLELIKLLMNSGDFSEKSDSDTILSLLFQNKMCSLIKLATKMEIIKFEKITKQIFFGLNEQDKKELESIIKINKNIINF